MKQKLSPKTDYVFTRLFSKKGNESMLINFLDVEEYHSQTVTVLKDHRDYIMNNPITYHYIELPKFREAEPDMENILYQWLTFIDNENKELVKMAVKKNREIKKANEEWEYLTGDEEIKRLEFLELKAALDYNSRLDYDIRMMEKEVRAESKKEKAIEIAKKMLKMQLPINVIMEATELKEEEIKNIKI